MNTYDVYLRKGASVQITALGYVENRRAGRFYFYSTVTKKDRETFFRIEDVAGIHLRNGMSPEQHKDAIRELEELYSDILKQGRGEAHIVEEVAPGVGEKGSPPLPAA